jgi:hypothetical protein
LLKFEYRQSSKNLFVDELSEYITKLKRDSDPNSRCYGVLKKEFSPGKVFAQTMKETKIRDPGTLESKPPLPFIFSMRRLARNLLKAVIKDLRAAGLFDERRSSLRELLEYLCQDRLPHEAEFDIEDFIASQFIPELPRGNNHEPCELGQCKLQAVLVLVSP